MTGDMTLAKRYARALLEVALERGEVEEVRSDLFNVAELYETSEALRTYLASPSFRRVDKRRALDAVLADKVAETTLRFLHVVIDKGRMAAIRAMADAFDEASDAARDVAKAHVTTYMPLEDAQRQALLGKLQDFTQRSSVRLEEEVDPSILGGVIVQLGDTLIDGSVRTRLARMREHLWISEKERKRRAAGMARKQDAGA